MTANKNTTTTDPTPGGSPTIPAETKVTTPDPFTLVLFGATGDLAGRKLFAAMQQLLQRNYLPGQFAIIGVGRREFSDAEFRQNIRDKITEDHHNETPAQVDEFLKFVHYQRADFTTTDGMKELAQRVNDVERERGLTGNRLFYLATDPEYFLPIVEGIAKAGMICRDDFRCWARVVIEKPFGFDLNSARELDRNLSRFVRADQIYRIDHYLGKETVQNLLAFRFGNAIFEPLFNRVHVDQVQITVAETVGMEGRRGAFYDHAGALRDVVQNHMLQLLALIAMDPPATLRAGDISDAKLKVIRSLKPIDGPDVSRNVVRGQYGPGSINGKSLPGYREEEAVDASSTTETFVAMKAAIENWRWAGVPFFLRTGKRMPRRVTEVTVQFKLPPLHLFRTLECVGDVCDLRDAQPSILTFRIQPDEGISLSFSAKRPGMQLDLHPVNFDFDYSDSFQVDLPEAYERLLLDALRGDATLFMRSDEMEAAWEFITPILNHWRDAAAPSFPNYAAGTWGPPDADRLVDPCFGGWHTSERSMRRQPK